MMNLFLMPLDKEVQVRLLAELEFSSKRARMSRLIQETDGTLLLLTKGSDSKVYERLQAGDEEAKAKVNEDLTFYSKQGYRTLALAVRRFAPGELDQWMVAYHEASTALENREQQLNDVYEQIEKNFELLGCTYLRATALAALTDERLPFRHSHRGSARRAGPRDDRVAVASRHSSVGTDGRQVGDRYQCVTFGSSRPLTCCRYRILVAVAEARH